MFPSLTAATAGFRSVVAGALPREAAALRTDAPVRSTRQTVGAAVCATPVGWRTP